MSRIIDSKNADLSGYEPMYDGGGGVQITHAIPPDEQSPSPFMVSSLPLLASGQDQLARQFYGRGRIPFFRIFQVL